MNLNQKTTIKLRSDDAQAIRRFIVGAVATPNDSAYYKLVLLIVARIAVAIHQKDTGKGVKLKLKAEEALALSILIATTDWMGNDYDFLLHDLQSRLPPLSRESMERPLGIGWDEEEDSPLLGT